MLGGMQRSRGGQTRPTRQRLSAWARRDDRRRPTRQSRVGLARIGSAPSSPRAASRRSTRSARRTVPSRIALELVLVGDRAAARCRGRRRTRASRVLLGVEAPHQMVDALEPVAAAPDARRPSPSSPRQRRVCSAFHMLTAWRTVSRAGDPDVARDAEQPGQQSAGRPARRTRAASRPAPAARAAG